MQFGDPHILFDLLAAIVPFFLIAMIHIFVNIHPCFISLLQKKKKNLYNYMDYIFAFIFFPAEFSLFF